MKDEGIHSLCPSVCRLWVDIEVVKTEEFFFLSKKNEESRYT